MNAGRTWDIYLAESLVVRKALSFADVRRELADGSLTRKDLIRPAGSERPWRRLADVDLDRLESDSFGSADEDQGLLDPNAEIDIDPDSDESVAPPQDPNVSRPNQTFGSPADLPSIELQALQWLMEDDEKAAPKPARKAEPRVRAEARPAPIAAHQEPFSLEPSIELELPHNASIASYAHVDDADESEDDFTLSRSRVEHVEEMDLAAMVDIAFQLVLFFMVTSAVTMIKSMELPKPTESTKPAAASAPGVGTRDKKDLEDEFIVVTIESDGAILVENEPIRADQLIERLRSTRNESGKTGMLLRAENKTKHRMAVAAYDAANEIGLRIAIERESADR
jgi:biopolymer transport protein ExbD